MIVGVGADDTGAGGAVGAEMEEGGGGVGEVGGVRP